VKARLHPTYAPVVFRDRTTGESFLTRSTLGTRADLPTVTWEDGRDYPLVVVDVSASSHPFWTGARRVVDTAGRVERFERRYGAR